MFGRGSSAWGHRNRKLAAMAARAAESKVNPQTRGDKIAQLEEKSAAQLARLADIEQQIYDLEGSYLEETQQSGSSLQVCATPQCPHPSLALSLHVCLCLSPCY